MKQNEQMTYRQQCTGWALKNGPPTLKSSDYIFAVIASILLNELFVMNLSFKGSVLSIYRSIRLKLDIKMCFQSDPNFYIFEQSLRGSEFVSKVALFFT